MASTQGNPTPSQSPAIWVLADHGGLGKDITQWLSAMNWRATTELGHVKQGLMSTQHGTVLVDARYSPHRMLTQIRFLHEHFADAVILVLVDGGHDHWGQEAIRQGADMYLSPTAVSEQGLSMAVRSLQLQKHRLVQNASALDPCTGLLNHSVFFDRLSHALQVAIRHHCLTGLLILEVDDFDGVSRAFTELQQDRILQLLAKRIQTCVRNSDSVARLSGAQFGVVLEDLHDDVMLAHIAQKIQTCLGEPMELEREHRVHLSISMGGHLCESGQQNGLSLLEQCKSALARAKDSPQKHCWFYSQDLNFRAIARQNMESGLRRAIEAKEFVLQCSPCHQAKGFMCQGVMPWITWRHPTAGMVHPDVFMGLLRDTGLIKSMGQWEIEQYLACLLDWHAMGLCRQAFRAFMPMSEKQLRDPDALSILYEKLSGQEWLQEHLVLVVNEKTAIRNVKSLQRLKEHFPCLGLGVKLRQASNTYGSLSYLQSLDADFLLLDSSFLLHMQIDHLETSLAKVVVNMAHQLGVDVVGLGADSQLKVEKMRALGCDLLCGDYFTKPFAPNEWGSYLSDH